MADKITLELDDVAADALENCIRRELDNATRLLHPVYAAQLSAIAAQLDRAVADLDYRREMAKLVAPDG